MMKRLILGAVLAAGLASPALAQRQGSYAVAGQTPDGQRYTGQLLMEPSGENTWRIVWQVAGDTANGVGLLIPQGPLLVVGYVAGRQTGVAVYAVQPDGRLLGTWTQGTEGGVGTEVLTPGGEGSAGK
jgi:hypothetical protein